MENDRDWGECNQGEASSSKTVWWKIFFMSGAEDQWLDGYGICRNVDSEPESWAKRQSFSAYQLIYVHTLNCSHKMQIQAAEMNFLSPFDEGCKAPLIVQLLFLHIDTLWETRSDAPGYLPGEVLGTSNQRQRRGCISWPAWERVSIPPEEMEEVARERTRRKRGRWWKDVL